MDWKQFFIEVLKIFAPLAAIYLGYYLAQKEQLKKQNIQVYHDVMRFLFRPFFEKYREARLWENNYYDDYFAYLFESMIDTLIENSFYASNELQNAIFVLENIHVEYSYYVEGTDNWDDEIIKKMATNRYLEFCKIYPQIVSEHKKVTNILQYPPQLPMPAPKAIYE